jgi:predicted pyridoxine 5'-phosphate oxidase superfamily flavin-nucleotide-binding protein
VEWPVDISRQLEAFLAAQRSVFIATASTAGQSYVQHRGGPAGFLKMLDSRTIGLADLRGNGQFITLGNLSENDRLVVFVMDYANRQRAKIWGLGRMVEDDPGLVERLLPQGGRADRAMLITVEAWDVNCPQHIPQRFEARGRCGTRCKNPRTGTPAFGARGLWRRSLAWLAGLAIRVCCDDASAAAPPSGGSMPPEGAALSRDCPFAAASLCRMGQLP